jgi:hypothetical protein
MRPSRSALPRPRRLSRWLVSSSRPPWHEASLPDVTLPETHVHRIRTWARGRVPEHLWPEVKVEADVADRHVDIVEVRSPWDGDGEHTRFPIARLR